jgi:hypothetical protein
VRCRSPIFPAEALPIKANDLCLPSRVREGVVRKGPGQLRSFVVVLPHTRSKLILADEYETTFLSTSPWVLLMGLATVGIPRLANVLP